MIDRAIRLLAVIASCCAVIPAIGQPATGATPFNGAPTPFHRASPFAKPVIQAEPIDVSLGALTLHNTIDAGLAQNRDVQIARAALTAAKGILVNAGKRPNPMLTVGAGPGLIGRYQPRDADVLVNVSQLVERGNKRELRSEVASLAADAAQFDIEDIFRQVRLALANAYFAVKQAQDYVNLAQATRNAFARSREAAELRLKAGDIARVDLIRLRVEEGRSENELLQAHTDLAVAQVMLATLLAREQEAPSIRAVDPWPVPGDSMLQSDRIEALVDKRPDIRAAIARVHSLEAAFGLAKAQRIRDVNVAVIAERNLPANGGTTLVVQLSMPIFINNDYFGDIVRAEAELTSAQINLEKLRSNVHADVDRALAQFESARQQLMRFEAQMLPDALSASQAAEFAYKKGGIPLTDLLDARRQLYATQRELLESRKDFVNARTRLESTLIETDFRW
ncbi:TolC family protein (plasmid) [Cupriavidus sp. P-10]|uniref:TolC family protein n=1 Tax=unclassified Cupriavidus TaxID=2640874 RepID=UPI000E2F7B2C|nr:TolC family protein [Cupriavidus sp. P-10]BDB30570.1 TolC family protein [Cupriavidus sp. P-10]